MAQPSPPSSGHSSLPPICPISSTWPVFHAADAASSSIGSLAALAADDLESVRLTLHPAATVVASAWPIVSIWTTNTLDAEVRRIGPDTPGEIALITRPDEEVFVHLLPQDADRLIAALADGAPLGEAAASVPDGFDLSTGLALLFSAGAVSGLLEGMSE